MAVAHDTQTRFPATENTADSISGDRTFSHTPTGTPAGVAVVIVGGEIVSLVTGVTYGGTAMTLKCDVTNTVEGGRVVIYTLTDTTIPSGAQDRKSVV